MKRAPGLVPFALFGALLAAGFIWMDLAPSARSGAAAPTPHTSLKDCADEGGGPPAPAPSDLRMLENEIHGALVARLGSDCALSREQEEAVRRTIHDGLAGLESEWKSGARADLDARLQEIYVRTRTSLATHLTEAQRQKLKPSR